jgi:MFS family permease
VFGTLCWFLSGALTMGLSRFVLGMGGVFFSTAALALTAATFTGEARSRVIGLQQATSQVVNVCAVFIVGALVDVTGWRGAFLLYGVFALLLFVLALLGVRRSLSAAAAPDASTTVGAPTDAATAGVTAASIPAAGATATGAIATGGSAIGAATAPTSFLRNIAPVCALTTLMGILTVIPMAQLPFVLADNGQGAPRQVSLVLGVNFVFAAISAMSFTRLTGAFGKPATFMAGLTCGMVGIALMGLTHGLSLSCVAAALAGLGTGIYNTYVFDHGVEISPPVYHGRAAGLLFAFMFFGAFINPLVAGLFAQIFGLHEAFPAMAVVAVLCGLPVILAGRK